MRTRRRGGRLRALAVVGVAFVVTAYVAFAPPSGAGSMRQFDPVRLANLETRMWQAYYEKERLRPLRPADRDAS